MITALLTAAFAGFGGAALAAPGDAGISLSPDTVSVNTGDTAHTTATIINNTGEEFTNYRVKAEGKSLTFGDEATLRPGDAGEISIDISVTDSMLGTSLTLTVEYKTASSGGSWQQGGSASFKINGKDQTPVIACTVTASQTLAAVGDQITFTFNIENQGYVVLENIQIWSDALKKGSALNSTAWTINSRKSYSWPYKYSFSTPKTVSFYITYTANGSEPKRYDVPQQFELKEEERKVKATLAADKSEPQPGEEVTFTLTIKNEGNVDYTNLTVTCDGEDLGAPAGKLAQGAELTKQYKKTFDVSTDVKFTVLVRDHTGQTRSVDTNTIHILLPVDPAALKNGLKIVIESDRDEFTSSGSVNFSGYIANDSDYTLSDVSVSEPSIGTVFSVSEMAAGARQSISCSADINATTTYTFAFKAKDRNGADYAIDAEPITVTIQSNEEATADPFESAPNLTIQPGDGSADPLLVWFIVAGVLVILIIGVGAALFVLWRNGRSARTSRSTAPKGRRPTRGGYNKQVRSRSFRDRNNF